MANGQRSPQVSSQQQELLSSVSKVLAQSGSAGISMGELAKRVGVSRPSLYYHFTDRTDIMCKLVADINDDADRLMQSLETREYASPTERLFDLCRERALLIFRKKYNFQLLVRRDQSLPDDVSNAREALKKRVFHYHRKVVEQGCKAGVFSAPNPTVATHGIIGMINWSAWWYDESEWDAETLANELANMCLASVSASGREELSTSSARDIPGIFDDIETSLAALRDAVSKP
jgi:AcrR family transcriptional regulator